MASTPLSRQSGRRLVSQPTPTRQRICENISMRQRFSPRASVHHGSCRAARPSASTTMLWSSRCGRPDTVTAPMQPVPLTTIGKLPPWAAYSASGKPELRLQIGLLLQQPEAGRVAALEQAKNGVALAAHPVRIVRRRALKRGIEHLHRKQRDVDDDAELAFGGHAAQQSSPVAMPFPGRSCRTAVRAPAGRCA